MENYTDKIQVKNIQGQDIVFVDGTGVKSPETQAPFLEAYYAFVIKNKQYQKIIYDARDTVVNYDTAKEGAKYVLRFSQNKNIIARIVNSVEAETFFEVTSIQRSDSQNITRTFWDFDDAIDWLLKQN